MSISTIRIESISPHGVPSSLAKICYVQSQVIESDLPPRHAHFVSLHWFSWLMLLLCLHSSAAFSSSTYSQHHALSQPVFMTSICICVWEICSVKNKGHLIIWFSVPGPPLQISPINVICKCKYSCYPGPPLKTLNWSPLIRPPNSAQTA